MQDSIRTTQVDRRANLLKLANYLWHLPGDYGQFDMSLFANSTEDSFNMDLASRMETGKPECGTVCCAAGHGPWAGIAPLPVESWSNYTARVFIGKQYYGPVNSTESLFNFLFSEYWARFDNTPRGAAQRIYQYLDGEVSDDWEFSAKTVESYQSKVYEKDRQA